MFITIDEYNSTTGETLAPYTFDRLARQTGDIINANTHDRIGKFEVVPQYVKDLQVDMIYTLSRADSQQGISSESNDGQSISYNNNYNVKKELIRMCLTALRGKLDPDGTPLIYGGV